MRDKSASSVVWKPSVCRRRPVWNSLTIFEWKMWFHPPFTELSEKMYAALKKPQRAGAAVISEPYWFELNVRTTPQTLLPLALRLSSRSRLFQRGFSDVSCREKL